MYAKKVVVLTDTLLPYPLPDWAISENWVDYVVQVDAIGDPEGHSLRHPPGSRGTRWDW